MLDDVLDFLGDLVSDVASWVAVKITHPAARGDELRSFLRNEFASFERWLNSLTVLEWVLLAVALGLILWVFAKVQTATTLAPIEVAPIEPSTAAGTVSHALTAELRRRIDEVGLRPPPDVPSGAPQANLLTAIEKSPIPQANWIATLLQAMPRPRPVSYKLTTTLLDTGHGVAFWLRPDGAGDSLLGTAEGTSAALRTVARSVLIHVSTDAVDIFPPWTRWDDDMALTCYLNGLHAAEKHQYQAAQASFQCAIVMQPDNAVARLRLLNAREAYARDPVSPLAPADPQLLRDYLALAIQRPELVEARYRASTLAALVATRAARDTTVALDVLGAEMTADDVRKVGKRILNQALAQLQPWFVPLVWHRPRYAIEPRGRERRHLKRTLEIAKRCHFARKHGAGEGGPSVWLRRKLWSSVVRLRANRSNAGWQVHYNAGCFFALIERTDEAYRYLNRALDGGGYRKVVDWMRDDPDLNGLRDGGAAWERLLDRKAIVNRRQPSGELRSILASLAAAVLGIALVIVVLAVPWAWAFIIGVALARVAWIFVLYLWRESRLVRLGATLP